MPNQSPKAARLSRWWTIEFSDGTAIDLQAEYYNELAAAILGTTCTGCPRLGDTLPAKVTAKRGAR